MRISPLLLETSCFTLISVRAVQGAQMDGGFEPHVQVGVQKHPSQDQAKWVVTLNVTVKGKGEAPPPYEAEVQIFGVFAVENFPEDRHEELVRVNGGGILYNSVREILLLLTARGPYLPVQLPTVSFFPDKPETRPSKTSRAENQRDEH